MRTIYEVVLALPLFLPGAFACALLVVGSPAALAACTVAATGTVGCVRTTKTTRAVNDNGNPVGASDRTQIFDNGASIQASIARGARIHNGGLRLTEAASAPQSITVVNQGRVSSSKSGQTLRIDGNGGPIGYAGHGSVANPGKKGIALSVDDIGAGAAAITTGRGLVKGGRGITAATVGGALSIATRSGRIVGTSGQAIKATTGLGALAVTVGKGGVSGKNQAAIETTVAGGNTRIAVDGAVDNTGKSHDRKAPPAILAHSDGAGDVVVDGPGNVTSKTGRGIWVQQREPGTGGILISGTGTTEGLGALCPGGHPVAARRHGETGCSGIRAVIKNPANTSDIVFDRSGPIEATSAGINGIDFGSGTIRVVPGATAKIAGKEFGIELEDYGTGDLSVAATGPKSAIKTAGTGILAENFAPAISAVAGSRIAIETDGTITSSGGKFDQRNRRNFDGTLAAVTAGYLGGAALNGNVIGAVTIANGGTLRAARGNGIQAFNLGSGAISVLNTGRIVAPTGITLIGTAGVTGTITNDGDIRSRATAIDVTRAHATTIDQQAGTVAGDIRLSGTGDTLDVGGGAIKGKILGDPARDGAAAGTVDFGAHFFRTGGAIDAANVTIASGTVALADNVTVFNALTNAATLDLTGRRQRTIDGTYVQTAGGTLAVPIGPGGATPLVVTKSAVLSGTLEVLVRRGPGGHFQPSGRYLVLEAGGGINGEFAALVPISPNAAPTPTLTTSANSVALVFPQRRSVFTAAATPNQAAAASALRGEPAGVLLSRAVLSQNAAGARQAFDAVSGEVHASAMMAAFEDSRLVREAILDRLQQAETPGAGWTYWSRDFGDFGRNGGNGNSATLDRSVGGVVLGADTRLANLPDWRVGVAGAFTQDALCLAGRSSTAILSTGQGAIYAGARYGMFDLHLGAAAGGSSIVANRIVSFPGFADDETSAYGDFIAQAFGEIGYRFDVGRATIEPLLAGAAIHVSQSAFAEQGGTAALTGAARSDDLGTTTLGMRGEMPVLVGVPLVGHVFLGWRHAYGDVDPTALLSFSAGSPSFVVAGVPIDRDALAAQAGLDWRATDRVTLGIAYTGQIGTRAQDEAFRGRLEIAF